MSLPRRRFLTHSATLVTGLAAAFGTSRLWAAVSDSALKMTVYKSPTCGCCSEWVDYMREEGFTVDAIDTDDVDRIKQENGLQSRQLASCHTALIDDYLIEGHVPAADVKRLLAERPDVVGLTAPGMPMQSPGMASRTPRDYTVYAFDALNRTRVWSSY